MLKFLISGCLFFFALDDITRSDVDQAVNPPTETSTQATDPVSSEFDKKKQLNALVSSAGSDAATMVLSERLGEDGKC